MDPDNQYLHVVMAKHVASSPALVMRCAFDGCNRPLSADGWFNVYIVHDTRDPRTVFEEHWCLACALLYYTGPSTLYVGRTAHELDSCRAPLK